MAGTRHTGPASVRAILYGMWRVFRFCALVALLSAFPSGSQALTVQPDDTVVYDRSAKMPLARIRHGLKNPDTWKAPHFVLQVLEEAARVVCAGESSCTAWNRGGFEIVSTLDWAMQHEGELLLRSSLRQNGPQAALGIGNGALAAVDYRTGEILAYAANAGFHSSPTPQLQPQYDVLSQARRQAGSIFKPFVYLPAIESGKYTPATLFLDATTEIEPGYTPSDNDGLERGPVRLRDALAFSLNIPAVKAAVQVGPERIAAKANECGITFSAAEKNPGPAIALGVYSIRPIEMLSAYAALANAGELSPRTTIREIGDHNGKVIGILRGGPKRVTSTQAAYLMTDMLARETMKESNPYLGSLAVRDRNGSRAAVAVKTGTTDGARDLWTVGYLPPGADKSEPSVAVLLWLGNSDASPTQAETAQQSAMPLWHAFVSSIAQKTALRPFERPPGLVHEVVDATSGYKPGPWTQHRVREWFLEGSVIERDPTKELVSHGKRKQWVWNLSALETELPAWRQDAKRWAARAAGSSADSESHRSAGISYFYNERYQPYGSSWGGAKFEVEEFPRQQARAAIPRDG